MDHSFSAFPELPVRRWISQDSAANRATQIVDICSALFEKYDADHDGYIDISQLDPEANSYRGSSPRSGGGLIDFSEFLTLMTRYEGDLQDETGLAAYFDAMSEPEFKEVIENLNEDYSSYVGNIKAVLGKLVQRSEVLCQDNFWEKIRSLNPSMHSQIFQSLNILLQAADEMEVTHALIGETRYQEIHLAARRAFSKFDTDSDGSIVWDEFKTVFSQHFEKCHSSMTTSDLELYSTKFASLQMDQFDENSDGMVSFDEFFSFLCLEGYPGDRTDTRQITRFFGTLNQETVDEILDVIKFYEQACVEQQS